MGMIGRDDACRVRWRPGMLSTDETQPIRCLAGAELRGSRPRKSLMRMAPPSTDFPSQEGISGMMMRLQGNMDRLENYQDEHKLRGTYRNG